MAKCAACYVYIILIILWFPLSIYLLSLICSYSYFEFSRFNVMKRIGYTAVDGSQFCVHQVSLPLAPVMFNRCHLQLASVTCVATHVWRWLSWHHKEANISWQDPMPHHENLIMLAIYCFAVFWNWRRDTCSVWACSIYLSKFKFECY